ncbi:MAG: outer membrane protein assembly factor [Bacteroidia bacterium]|jgi:hypothetical protein|nr:outer membrane protein assembly factor [Bacteroidia bacterium]
MNCTNVILIIYVILFLSSTTAYSQQTDSLPKLSVLPVPTIGRSIETNWYFGAVTLFKLKHYFKSSLYSTAKLEFNYTLNKQVILNSAWYVYMNKNKQIMIGENAYLFFPEYYYGIGNQSSDKDGVFYSAHRVELNNALLWNTTRKFYLGGMIRVQGINNIQIKTGKLEVANELVNNNAEWSYGVGPKLLVDKRSNLLNPEPGDFYIDVEEITYYKQTPTQQSSFFANIRADVRYYHKLFKKINLAWQYVGLYGLGNQPYRLMGLLGSDSHMRGYYLGRYRDRNYTAIQTEARIQLIPWLGFTIFGGVGDVWRNYSDLQFEHIKYSTGLGLRLRVDKTDRINLRLDYAIGKETTGFYVAFGEAF